MMSASGLTVTPPRFHFRCRSDRFGTSKRRSQSYTLLATLNRPNAASPVVQRNNAIIVRAMSASLGDMTDDSTGSAVFPRINVRDPYKRLGISMMASEDEIQGARNFLIHQYAGHKPSVDAIESDKIIMQKFHERKNPKMDMTKKVRQVRQSKAVNFVFERFQTPPTAFLVKTAATFAVLGALTVLFPTEEEPTLQVLLSVVSTFYFIHQRLKKKLCSGLSFTGKPLVLSCNFEFGT